MISKSRVTGKYVLDVFESFRIDNNYVILHYDPKVEAFSLTKKQIEAKKDPILFGVIKDVRKLYFIGDWKDDICDLTLNEVASVLGRPVDLIDNDPSLEA